MRGSTFEPTKPSTGRIEVETFKFSKRGDQGETSLLTGERVSKASLRPEAYGTLDEASSALGLAKTSTRNSTILTIIESIQQDLLALGAELACEQPEKSTHRIDPQRTVWMEEWIEKLQKEAPLPRVFVLPGANAPSAALDLARTIIRRAERRVVAMKEAGLVEDMEMLSYLNRLADLLFVLARYAERHG
jgi:cob(I)alamin adenosyltransferase